MLENVGFDNKSVMKVGFEPGTHKRVQVLADEKSKPFTSLFPIIDIRHGNNLTASKWSAEEFRDPKNAKGWEESKAWDILGWEYEAGSEEFDITRLKPTNNINLVAFK